MRDGATGTVKAVRLVHRQQCFGAFERDALLAQRVCSGAQAPQPPAGDCTGRTQAFRPFHDQECRPLEEGGRIPIRSHTGVIGMDAKRSAKGAGYSSREREPFRWTRFMHD